MARPKKPAQPETSRDEDDTPEIAQILRPAEEDLPSPEPLTEGFEAPVGEDVPAPEVQPVPIEARSEPPEAAKVIWNKKGDKDLKVEVLKHHHGLVMVRDAGTDGPIYTMQIDDLDADEAEAERLQAPFPEYGPGVEAPYDAHGGARPDADPVPQPSALDG